MLWLRGCMQLSIDGKFLLFVRTVESIEEAKPIEPFIHCHASDATDHLIAERRPSAVYLLMILLASYPGVADISLNSFSEVFRRARVSLPFDHDRSKLPYYRVAEGGAEPVSELVEIHWPPFVKVFRIASLKQIVNPINVADQDRERGRTP